MRTFFGSFPPPPLTKRTPSRVGLASYREKFSRNLARRLPHLVMREKTSFFPSLLSLMRCGSPSSPPFFPPPRQHAPFCFSSLFSPHFSDFFSTMKTLDLFLPSHKKFLSLPDSLTFREYLFEDFSTGPSRPVWWRLIHTFSFFTEVAIFRENWLSSICKCPRWQVEFPSMQESHLS